MRQRKVTRETDLIERDCRTLVSTTSCLTFQPRRFRDCYVGDPTGFDVPARFNKDDLGVRGVRRKPAGLFWEIMPDWRLAATASFQ